MRQTGQPTPNFPAVWQEAHYPELDWPVIVMVKHFSSRTRTGPHSHERGQLMVPADGFVVAKTAAGTWFVPRGHALWIPPGLQHDVSMHSDVLMHAAYVEPAWADALPRQPRVMRVEPLLAAVLGELAHDTSARRTTDRARHLTWIALDEVARARETPFVLPLPEDRRLARLTDALIAHPGSDRTIDQWSDVVALSRRTMTRLFRTQTGLSFGDWRRRLRLIVAITRIAEGDPPAKVAAALGYRNIAAFRTMARRYVSGDLLVQRREAKVVSGAGGKPEGGDAGSW